MSLVNTDFPNWQLSQLFLGLLVCHSRYCGDEDPGLGVHLADSLQDCLRVCAVQAQKGDVPRLADLLQK